MNLYKNAKFLTNLTLSLTLAALIPVSTVYAQSSTNDFFITSNAEAEKANLMTEEEKLAAEAERMETETQAREAAKQAALETLAEIEKAEAEAQAAAEQAAAEQAMLEATTTTSSYEPTYYTEAADNGQLTASKGVVYYNGHRETYYSQNVLPGGGLNIPGRHVAEDGTVRDADNYICVASSDLAKGTVVETSLGTGKVYDSGCASGTIDIYTNW